jgi:hypothetical protein
MARNLTEDEVKFIEERRKQQQEQSRRDEFEGGMSGEELEAIDKRRQEMAEGWRKARVSAMGDAARGWRRGQAERDADERRHWDDLHRETHGGLSRGEVVALGPDGSGRQAAGIRRAAELQAAHGRELEKMGTMDVTREREAELKMIGMRDQGMGAARLNAAAAKHDSDNRFRAAELEWGARERMGTADNATKLKLGEMEGKWRKDTNDANVEIAGVQADATVQAAREKATAEFARDLMQQRQLDQKTALQYAQGRSQRALKMVNDSKDRRTGKARLSYEEALKRIDEEDKATGNLPGRALQEFVKQ